MALQLPPPPYGVPIVDNEGKLSSVWSVWINTLSKLVKSSSGGTITNPMTSVGDTTYGGAAGVFTRLAGNGSTVKQFLNQTGKGSASAAPLWGPIAVGDVPTLNQNTTGTASNITATSNSTLTTLPSLSLPYGQVTGTPSLAGFAVLAPTSNSANTIQSTTASITPLTLKQKAGSTTTGPITWGTNSGANVSVSGSTVTRVAASAWDGGALGNTQITSSVDGYIEWTENDITKLHVGGLSNASGAWSYSSVGFGIYNNNGVAQIYESGTNSAAFATIVNGDVLRVSCTGGVVKYFQNGVLKYTSLLTPTFPLYGMVSEYTQNGAFNPTYSTTSGTQTVDLMDFTDINGTVLSSIDRMGRFVGPVTGNVTGNVSGSSGSCTGNSSTVTTNANLTGPVTSVGNATSVTANAITNAMIAQMATNTIKGNNAAGAANAADLTVAQVNAILPVFTSTLNGLAPLSGGGTANYLRADGTWAAPTSSASIQVAIFNESQANGTSGGTFTSGAWQTRTLNTVAKSQTWASLATNQITLSAGTYLIEAFAPVYNVNRHQAKIYNITGSADAFLGQSFYTTTTGGIATVVGTVAPTGATVYELRHWCSLTEASDGFGIAASAGSGEIFSIVKVTKLA